MSRSRGAAPSVDLFPFTAVLLSVMGVLIVLLFGLTSSSLGQEPVPVLERDHVDVEALRSAIAEQEARNSDDDLELEHRNTEHAAFLEDTRELEEQRDELKEDLETDRARRRDRPAIDVAALVQRIEELRFATRSESERSEKQLGSVERAEADAAEREEKAREYRDETTRRKNRVPVVWEGESKTDLQPVFFDCTAGELVQAGGDRFELGIDDLEFTPEDDAFMEHLKVLGKAKCYPVFIVRPSGVRYYLLAALLARKAEVSYGYLVVEDGVVLEYPTETEDPR